MIKNERPYSLLTTDLDLNGNSIVYVTPSTDGSDTGDVETVTVDTNGVGIGALLIRASDDHYDEADADAEATTAGLLAIALATGTGSKTVLTRGQIYKANWGFSPTSGALAYVGLTQGVVTQTKPTASGDFVRCIGAFKNCSGTAGVLVFDPDNMYTENA